MKKKLTYEQVIANLCRVGFDDYSSVDCELEMLKGAFEKCDDAFLYPYIPMRLVALMEGNFQEIYSTIIDADIKYRKNFAKLVKEVQFDFPIIDSFEQNTITFGEYASMLLPCNKLEDMLTNINGLLGVDGLKVRFSDTTILRDIEEIFYYRHIFCHEIAGEVRLEQSQVLKMIESTSDFIRIVGSYIYDFLFPDAPQLTCDIIEEAQKDFEAKEKGLHDLIDWLEKNLDETVFDDSGYLDIFEEYRKKRSVKMADKFYEGSSYEYFYIRAKTEITEELIAGLKKKYRFWLRKRNL